MPDGASAEPDLCHDDVQDGDETAVDCGGSCVPCRGNPLDTFSHDMNRIYPGRADGYLSERIAHAHAQWMTKIADIEISIHSGGAHSFLAPAMFTDERPASVELGTAMGPGWGCMMSSQNPKGNPMAAVNVRCLEGIDLDAVPVKQYDGRAA